MWFQNRSIRVVKIFGVDSLRRNGENKRGKTNRAVGRISLVISICQRDQPNLIIS
jgi:hypothetical protein